MLENGLEATVTFFIFFCHFLTDEVENVFWESKAKPLKKFEFKVCHRKHFGNWF